MHYAIDNIDVNIIFPTGYPSMGMENPSAFKKCKTDLRSSDLNQLQVDAIINMLKHSSVNVSHLCRAVLIVMYICI